jgi:hypothetical protein
VLPVLLGEQFLSSRVDIRVDGILGHVADSGLLGNGVALGFLNDDQIDRLMDRAVAGDQLSKNVLRLHKSYIAISKWKSFEVETTVSLAGL